MPLVTIVDDEESVRKALSRLIRAAGFDVQQALALANRRLPIVIVTGDDSLDSRERALKLGAKAYLRKPVDDAILLDAIRTAIGTSPPSPPG